MEVMLITQPFSWYYFKSSFDIYYIFIIITNTANNYIKFRLLKAMNVSRKNFTKLDYQTFHGHYKLWSDIDRTENYNQ